MGKHEVKKAQKTAILSTAHLPRKVSQTIPEPHTGKARN